MNKAITQSELMARVRYDPDTGLFNSLLTGRVLTSTEVSGYRVMRLGRRVTHKQHRLAFLYMTGQWPTGVVDHINGDKTDNRWANLRDVTIKLNLQNVSKARSTSTTGVLGVFRSGSRFYSQIQVEKKFIRLGTFDTVSAAQEAYVNAKRKHHEGFLS